MYEVWMFLLISPLICQSSVSCEVKGEFTSCSSVIVRKFTSYALEYHSHEKALEESSCPVEMATNVTEIELSGIIDRCASVGYYPRYLHPYQVSWKRTRGQVHDQYAKYSGEYRNSAAAFDAVGEDYERIKKNEGREIVTEFLAFALLLPEHPFSNDLYSSVVTIAPMYPQIVFVVGNAYEFTELCAQYGVRSFPKLLFFQEVSELLYDAR